MAILNVYVCIHRIIFLFSVWYVHMRNFPMIYIPALFCMWILWRHTEQNTRTIFIGWSAYPEWCPVTSSKIYKKMCPLLNQHSYEKWPFIVDIRLKWWISIISYVSLPEGNLPLFLVGFCVLPICRLIYLYNMSLLKPWYPLWKLQNPNQPQPD